MKYIIEIAKEYEEYFKGILICGIADGKFAVDVIAREDLEELTSDYINEHFGELQDKAYQRGLDEAWEAAKKVALYADGGGLSIEELNEIFDCATIQQVFRKYTLSEVIAKLKAYEKKQKADELKVGDIVDWSGEKYIVSYIYDDGCTDLIYLECGSVCESVSPDCFTRTGKHYDITKILEEMKE